MLLSHCFLLLAANISVVGKFHATNTLWIVRAIKNGGPHLQIFTQKTAGEILRNVGYDKEMIERVRELLRKENLKYDPEVQLLEDVACLVFLDSYLADFSKQHAEEKLLRIINKTWQKMSEQGREAARTLNLASDVRKILGKGDRKVVCFFEWVRLFSIRNTTTVNLQMSTSSAGSSITRCFFFGRVFIRLQPIP